MISAESFSRSAPRLVSAPSFARTCALWPVRVVEGASPPLCDVAIFVTKKFEVARIRLAGLIFIRGNENIGCLRQLDVFGVEGIWTFLSDRRLSPFIILEAKRRLSDHFIIEIEHKQFFASKNLVHETRDFGNELGPAFLVPLDEKSAVSGKIILRGVLAIKGSRFTSF
jgi:hypothetical protein